MKTIKKISVFTVSSLAFIGSMLPITNTNASDKIIYPLKEISKLECRFKEFKELGSDCKQSLPVLKTKDYKKYAKLNGGYNDFTRLYTVLWASSYKYGWDVGNGGHMGTDIATSRGTPVYTIADGEVIVSGNLVALGNTVSVKHKINGKVVVSNYSHLSKINVKKGQKIKVGTKIGEVGSTGNSTGNHLHFQIDLDTPSHPYYYSYKACPYSYYKISEQGLCFNDLNSNTLDPLAFLETNGGILDNIQVSKKPSSNKGSTSNNSQGSNTGYDMSIFDRTVYVGYGEADIKEVQRIYRDLGEYNGPISGDYKDIEKYIISYQISNNIIKDKTELGAGWFGPKTRLQTKHDYQNFLANGGKRQNDNDYELSVENKNKVEKISKDDLITREEIERREVEDFIRKYNLDFKLENKGGNIELNKSTKLKLTITDKRGRPFKGNMPSGMTFIVDTAKVNVFPQKLYNFTDGKRDIKLTGLKAGDTVLYIKVGTVTIKSIPLKVYSSGQEIYPESSQIISNKTIVLGDNKTAIVLFKDNKNKRLIDIRYGSTFKLKASNGVEVCIKKGSLKDIRKVYKRTCRDSDYQNSVDFTYDDTVGGLLIFDYKAVGKSAKVEVINNYNNKQLSTRTFSVKNPKGLNDSYVYTNEVIKMLEQGVVEGINKGYFLEKRDLNELDALIWIENMLENASKDNMNPKYDTLINSNLAQVRNKKLKASKFKQFSREDFLELTYNYLVLDKSDINVTRDYKDLSSDENFMANAVFANNNTWKDKFGENYFRPDMSISRGEGAYILSNIMQNNNQVYLTMR